MDHSAKTHALPNRAGFSRCEYTPGSGLLVVSGWALGRVQSVELITNSGVELDTARLGTARADVTRKFSEYHDEAPGWELRTIFGGDVSDLFPVTASIRFEDELLSLHKNAEIKADPLADYGSLLSDTRYRELSALFDFVSSLRAYLSPDDYDALIAVCERNDFAIAKTKNFRKRLLLEVFGEGPVRLMGRKVAFANVNDAVVLIDEILVQDCYGYTPSQSRPVVVDLGASNGLFATTVLHRFPDSRVIAVEPNPQNTALLKNNLACFDPDRVRIIEAAVGSGAESGVQLSVPVDTGLWGGLGASTQDRTRFASREMTSLLVPSVRLDEIITEDVDFLKMDIEGFEYDVFLDNAACLSRVRRFAIEVHLDVHDAGHRLAALISMLEDYGFVLSFSGPPAGLIDQHSVPSALVFGNRV